MVGTSIEFKFYTEKDRDRNKQIKRGIERDRNAEIEIHRKRKIAGGEKKIKRPRIIILVILHSSHKVQ